MEQTALITGLKRLAAANPSATDRMERGEQAAYVEEVRRVHGWLSAREWTSVVDWCVRNRKGRSMPTVSEIGAAVTAVSREGLIRGRQGCAACSGSGLVEAFFRHQERGEIAQWAKPCPQCCGGRSHGVPYGWEPTDIPASPFMRMAVSFSPGSAQKALDAIEAKGDRPLIPEDVYLTLVQRAGQPRQKGEPPIRPLADAIGDIPRPQAKPAAREVDV